MQMPPHHHNAPAGTSEVAAASVASRTWKMRADVLAAIIEAGPDGLTDAEIQARTGMGSQSECPRRLELERAGLIADSGRRRATPRGRKAAVWVLAEHAPGHQHTIEEATR